MTCVKIHNGIICVNPWGRIKVGSKYVWIDYHTYCGPTFWRDRAMTKIYDPANENDPVWPEFEKWLTKYEARRKRGNSNHG